MRPQTVAVHWPNSLRFPHHLTLNGFFIVIPNFTDEVTEPVEQDEAKGQEDETSDDQKDPEMEIRKKNERSAISVVIRIVAFNVVFSVVPNVVLSVVAAIEFLVPI